MKTSDDKLIIAISSRALFDLEESHRVFTEQGVDAYYRFQIEHENDPLAPGVAFPLVKKLLALNADRPQTEIILLSRNDANTGLRIFNSIRHYGLDIERAAFAGGASPFPYIQPFAAHLFLSADPEDVRRALEAGVAAATLLPRRAEESTAGQLRIAFDGDAVLFGDVAERVYRQHGLAAFNSSEQGAAHEPLPGGPFKGFLAALHRIQSRYPAERSPIGSRPLSAIPGLRDIRASCTSAGPRDTDVALADSPIRTALFTARGAPAHERVIRTLRAWDIRIDEAVFLGGLDKGEFLRAFRADVFFDDQQRHCDSAHRHVPTGHVPHGVANEG